jgi:hypothetical protein
VVSEKPREEVMVDQLEVNKIVVTLNQMMKKRWPEKHKYMNVRAERDYNENYTKLKGVEYTCGREKIPTPTKDVADLVLKGWSQETYLYLTNYLYNIANKNGRVDLLFNLEREVRSYIGTGFSEVRVVNWPNSLWVSIGEPFLGKSCAIDLHSFAWMFEEDAVCTKDDFDKLRCHVRWQINRLKEQARRQSYPEVKF